MASVLRDDNDVDLKICCFHEFEYLKIDIAFLLLIIFVIGFQGEVM